MRCSHLLAAVAAIMLAPAARPAVACGPDFPVALLLDRGAALGELPGGAFLTEAEHLVTPTHAYPVVIGHGPEPADAGTRERALYAAGRYRAVLALPAASRRHRSTWAAYMLGREDDSIERYRQVRALVDAGFEDLEGLAASSLGQEARLHLNEGRPVVAIRLYAEQAALGHPDGATSLYEVAHGLVEEQREAEVLGDRLGQRLIALYLATHSGELEPARADALFAELAAVPDLAGAEQLAAWAYRRGLFDQAAALLRGKVTGPTADWVRAKLALRDGDRPAADRLLASAAAGFAARTTCDAVEPASPDGDDGDDDDGSDDDGSDDHAHRYASATESGFWLADLSCSFARTRARVVGERVVLAVEDGRFADALALAWEQRVAHPDDVADIAERLVTLDELMAFVERVAPEASDEVPQAFLFDARALRALLGRRLMRAGRSEEASAYLPADRRLDAVVLAQALAASRHGDRFERARALYTASRITRRLGLELLGTTAAPDWGLYAAEYDRGTYAGVGELYDEEGEPLPRPRHPFSVAELTRRALTAMDHEERYHYRYQAADLANQAAELLPEGSPARRAMRCWAGRYVGASYDTCDEPDVDAARTYRRPERRYVDPPRPSWLKRLGHRLFGRGPAARRHAYGSAAAVVILLLVGGGGVVWRRRWRRFSPRP